MYPVNPKISFVWLMSTNLLVKSYKSLGGVLMWDVSGCIHLQLRSDPPLTAKPWYLLDHGNLLHCIWCLVVDGKA